MEQHDKSGKCNWWNISKGLWARTQTAVLQIELSTFNMKSQGWTKSVAHETDDYFGLWHLRCSCVSCNSTGWNCEYGSTCPELIENATILHNNATAHLADAVKNVVWLYNNHPVFLTSATGLWSLPETEAVIAWRMIADRRNVLRVACQKLAHSIAASGADGVGHLPIIDDKLHTTSWSTLKVVIILGGCCACSE
jgi:hypothetical protein